MYQVKERCHFKSSDLNLPIQFFTLVIYITDWKIYNNNNNKDFLHNQVEYYSYSCNVPLVNVNLLGFYLALIDQFLVPHCQKGHVQNKKSKFTFKMIPWFHLSLLIHSSLLCCVRSLVDILRHQSSPVQQGERNNVAVLTTTTSDGRTSKSLYTPILQIKDNRSKWWSGSIQTEMRSHICGGENIKRQCHIQVSASPPIRLAHSHPEWSGG